MSITERRSKKKSKNNFDLALLRKIRGRVYYNGKLLTMLDTNGCRDVYRVADCIVKIEDYNWQTSGTIKFFKHLQKEDSKYFPKLVDVSLTRKIVVERFIPLDFKNRKKSHRKIITRLRKKYKLCDVIYNYNWAVNKKTNLPIIYDVGCNDW